MSEQSKKEIEDLEIEKEKIIEQAREKLDEIKQDIIAKQKELSGLDKTFKEEYDKRLKALEDKEILFRETEIKIDALTRDYENAISEFEKDKESFLAYQKELQAETQSLIDKNSFILVDIASEKSNVDSLIANEKLILEKISEEQGNALALKSEVEQATAVLQQKENAVNEKINTSNDLLNKIESETKADRDAKADLLIKEGDIRILLDEQRGLIERSSNAFSDLEAKKSMIDIERKKLDDVLNQINVEREKNMIDAIANRAKEISNNEKERALNERERNLKILEQSKG